MGSSQALFWAIAVPATTLIGSLSLLIAYRGTHTWAKVRAMGDAIWKPDKIPTARSTLNQKPKDVERQTRTGQYMHSLQDQVVCAGERRC